MWQCMGKWCGVQCAQHGAACYAAICACVGVVHGNVMLENIEPLSVACKAYGVDIGGSLLMVIHHHNNLYTRISACMCSHVSNLELRRLRNWDIRMGIPGGSLTDSLII